LVFLAGFIFVLLILLDGKPGFVAFLSVELGRLDDDNEGPSFNDVVVLG
jgi:hypothetical protein